MGRTLRTYVIGEVGIAFSTGLAICTFVLLIARILDLVDLILSRGVPPARVLELFAYILPSFLEMTVPMALLIGIVVAFGRLAADGELIAIRSAGISLEQVLRPVLTFALLAGALTLALAIFARPWAKRHVRQTVYDIAKTRATAALQPRVFNSDFDGIVIYVDDIDRGAGLLKGIMLSDERESYRRTTIFASAGRLLTDEANKSIYLQMLDGTSLSYHAGQESYDKTDFASFEVNLDIEKDVGTGTGAEATRPSEMDWATLLDSRRRRLEAGDPAIEENLELHRKFSVAAACLLLAVIGIPLGMQRTRAVRARGLAVSIVVVLAYYVMLTASMAMARKQTIDPALAAWLPDVVLLIAGALMFRRVARDRRLLPASAVLGGLWRRAKESPA